MSTIIFSKKVVKNQCYPCIIILLKGWLQGRPPVNKHLNLFTKLGTSLFTSASLAFQWCLSINHLDSFLMTSKILKVFKTEIKDSCHESGFRSKFFSFVSSSTFFSRRYIFSWSAASLTTSTASPPKKTFLSSSRCGMFGLFLDGKGLEDPHFDLSLAHLASMRYFRSHGKSAKTKSRRQQEPDALANSFPCLSFMRYMTPRRSR